MRLVADSYGWAATLKPPARPHHDTNKSFIAEVRVIRAASREDLPWLGSKPLSQVIVFVGTCEGISKCIGARLSYEGALEK